MVSKVADGGPASKEDGLKIQDVILKVRMGEFFENPPPFNRIFLARVLRVASDCMTRRCVDFSYQRLSLSEPRDIKSTLCLDNLL